MATAREVSQGIVCLQLPTEWSVGEGWNQEHLGQPHKEAHDGDVADDDGDNLFHVMQNQLNTEHADGYGHHEKKHLEGCHDRSSSFRFIKSVHFEFRLESSDGWVWTVDRGNRKNTRDGSDDVWEEVTVDLKAIEEYNEAEY